jgi:hypothetical protein
MQKVVVTCCFEINHDPETMADVETIIHHLVREDFLYQHEGESFYIVQHEVINE